ncbi:MAG: hypothetical protein P0107_03520 [Nitrosomonas sp.]|nr:hypothetical protein [Nitrosomonas sp.]
MPGKGFDVEDWMTVLVMNQPGLPLPVGPVITSSLIFTEPVDGTD